MELYGIDMRDILPFSMSVGGGTVAYKAPSISEPAARAIESAIDWTFTFQVIGALVGLVGIILGVLRHIQSKHDALERKRTNDIAAERLNWEMKENGKNKNA